MWQSVALILLGCVATGVLNGVGGLVRRGLTRTDRQASLNATEATDLALLKHDVADLRVRMEKSERHRAALGEELTTVAAILDRHEQWHARNGGTSTRGG